MSKRKQSDAQPQAEFLDAIHRDWEKIRDENPSPSYDRLNTPFSPLVALRFAEELANVKSEDDGLGYTARDPAGLAAFLVAAHFAYPYLPLANDQAGKNQLRFSPPYVSLAKSVVNFLNSLPPLQQREQE
jgi:hypothetical protein